MMISRCRAAALLSLSLAAACYPKAPAPDVQCTKDSDCFSGGVCTAAGTCVLGSVIDPAKSTVEVSQPDAIADGVDKITITVTVRDTAGNTLGSRGVQLTIDGAANTLTQPNLATNAIGQVTGTLVSTKAEAKTIHAVAGLVLGGTTAADKGVALSGAPVVTFHADPGHIAPPGTDAGSSTVSVTNAAGGNPDVPADGVSAVKIALKLIDAHGNPVPAVPVFLDLGGTGNTITPSGTATAADGTYSASITSHTSGIKPLTVTAGPIHVSKDLTFRSGQPDPTHSTVTVSNSTMSADQSAATHSTTLTITARDEFDNLLPAMKVYIAGGPGEATNSYTPIAQKGSEALTGPDGKVTVQVTSSKAEVKHLRVHIEAAVVSVPAITVTPGDGNEAWSFFEVTGNADGTPLVADLGLGATAQAYTLRVYIADSNNNPVAGQTVNFGDPDVNDLIAPAASGATDATGSFSAFLGSSKAGVKTVTASFTIPGATLSAPFQVTFIPGTVAQANSTIDVAPLSVSTDPAPANHATVTVKLADANDNPISDAALTIDATGTENTFGVPTVTNGTYTTTLSSSTAETKTVKADVGTVHLTKDVAFTAGAVSGGNSTVVTVNATNPKADNAEVATFTIKLLDAQGNPVPGVTPVPTVTPATGNTVVTAAGPTAANGTTTFSFKTIKAETKTVTVAAGGATLAGTAQVTFDAGAATAATSVIAVTPSTITADGQNGATVTLTVKDANGNPVKGVSLTVADSPANGGFTPVGPYTTGADGTVTVVYKSTVATSETLTFTAAGGYTKTTNVTVQAGAASSANTALSANPTSLTANGITTSAITVIEKDNSNNVIANCIALTASGTATIAPATAQSSATGAAFTIKSTVAGAQTITAYDKGAYPGCAGTATPVKQLTVTFTPAAPTTDQTSFTASPTSVVANNTALITMTVLAKDANGNPANNVAVTFTTDDPNLTHDTLGCVQGATGCTVNGNKTVTQLTDLTGTAAATVRSTKSGTRNLSASVGGAFTKGPLAVTFTPGGAAGLTFSVQPADVNAGAVMAAVKVALQDQFGNPTPADSATITVAVNGGGTLGGTVTQGTTSGVATFNNLTVSDGAGAKTLTASATSMGSAQSGSFNVIPPFASTGADGAFTASGSVSLPARVYNYTTINIAAGARVTSDGNGILELRAQGAVTINGVLDISGGAGGSVTNGVNGGGAGGSSGVATAAAAGLNFGGAGTAAPGGSVGQVAAWGTAGGAGAGGLVGGVGGPMGGGGGGGGADQNADMDTGGGSGGGGPAGGAGGFAGADGCVAAGGAGGGSGGGKATACGAAAQGGGSACAAGATAVYVGGTGGIGSSPCATIAGSGGGGSIGCDAASDLALVSTFRPGSGGGGGGSGGDANEPGSGQHSGGGGGGGGGGGAVRIVSPVSITLGAAGQILANGGGGGSGAVSADDCNDDSGGGGGGGSGGAVWLSAPAVVIPSGSRILAVGGGGGAGGATTAAGPGGAGGLGRVRLSLDPAASSIAGTVNPPPVNGVTPAAAAAGKAFVAHYPQ